MTLLEYTPLIAGFAAIGLVLKFMLWTLAQIDAEHGRCVRKSEPKLDTDRTVVRA